MKINYTCETTEGETAAFLDFAGRLVQVILTRVAPVEAPVEAPVAPPVSSKKQKRIEAGREILAALVSEWGRNLGQEGTEQPDRGALLREVATGRSAGAVLEFVSSVGGLTHGIDAVIASWPWERTEEDRRALVWDITGNIVQVASLLFPDLAEQYEHRNIYQDRN